MLDRFYDSKTLIKMLLKKMVTTTIKLFKKSGNAKGKAACKELSKKLDNVLNAQFLSTLSEGCGITKIVLL